MNKMNLSLRPSLRRFSYEMEKRLQENDGKSSWRDCDSKWLFMRLIEEAGELARALDGDYELSIISEAADVANFAMMIVDCFQPVADGKED